MTYDINMPKIIGIILARGGSKRVVKKNIRIFHGKPMIAYAIQSAINAKIFDRLIVSTDCVETAQISQGFGAEVPGLRSFDLSGDNVPTTEVMSELVKAFNLSNEDMVCCMYGTNPFLTSENLKLACEILKDSARQETNYVSTITEYSFPPQRGLKRISENHYEMVSKEFLMSRSQDLDRRFHECAQFWWAYADTWLKQVPMQEGLRGILLPRWHQQDIDTEEDWKEAEIKFAAWGLNF